MKAENEMGDTLATRNATDPPAGTKDHPRALSRPLRLAAVLTHPIQYFGPMFRRVAQRPEIELTVLYASLQGAQPYKDTGFDRVIAWDVPLLEGYRHKVLRNYGSERLGAFLRYATPEIVWELKRGRYDAVMVFGWGHAAAWLAFAGARWARIPFMLYGDSVPLYEGEIGGPKRLVKRLVLRRLFGRAGAFLATGTLNRLFYASYGVPAHKCFDVPLAVDNEFFRNTAENARKHRADLRASYGLKPDAVVILFVGKLVPGKRPRDLLAVLKNLQPDFPQLTVAFAGDGELRPYLEAEIARDSLKNAFLLGFVNQSKLPEVYALSDIFVMPSMFDNRGVVVNEAMACSLPVVVTDKTGVWGPGDIVVEGHNGFVYSAGDTDELTRLVRKLVVDSRLREEMGARSLEIVQRQGYNDCVNGILRALYFVKGWPAPSPGVPAGDPAFQIALTTGPISGGQPSRRNSNG